MPTDVPIGERIKKVRKEKKVTLKDLEKKIGVSNSALSQIETGVTKSPERQTLIALARELKDNFGETWLNDYLRDDGAEEVKVVGRVAAGRPLTSFETDELISIPSRMVATNKQTFAVQVQGDSMVNIGIMHGDIVILHECLTPTNGTTVVVRIGEGETAEYTIKTWFKTESSIILKPENEQFDSITIEKGISEVVCIGEYAGLIRFAK